MRDFSARRIYPASYWRVPPGTFATRARSGRTTRRGYFADQGDVPGRRVTFARPCSKLSWCSLSWRRTGPAAVRPVPGCERAGSLAAETD